MNEQYQYMFDKTNEDCRLLGCVSGTTWKKDPKRLGFVLARYKFVSKMVSGLDSVLEIGCGDGWASKVVYDVVKSLILTDVDQAFVDEASKTVSQWSKKAICRTQNFIESSNQDLLDGIYCLDVLEHIERTYEKQFLSNIWASLRPGGLFIVGMPSIESQTAIAPEKRDPGHINCKSLDELKNCLQRVFKTVLPFSMNDEVLHTGQAAMSNYILCICVK